MNVDSTSTTNCIEWFFGYGGNHLGLRWVIPNLRVIAACEIEAYALANVVAKMEAGALEPFPIWSDCRTFPCEPFRGLVDLFIASYPCQGFSQAGQRKGEGDPRFLWPYCFRAIAVIQPRRVFLENVEGHVSLGLERVIGDLEAAGYRSTWGLFSAAECGAPQRRKRVFIFGELGNAARSRRGASRTSENELGHPDSGGGTKYGKCGRRPTLERDSLDHGRREKMPDSAHGSGEDLADTQKCGSPWHWPNFVARSGEPQHEWEPPRVTSPQLRLGGGADGRAAALDTNTDRLRLLGNGVYPACAALAYITLGARLKR